MNKRNLFENKKVALTFNDFMKANFVPGRLIVNKIKASRPPSSAKQPARMRERLPQ
jgi:hypothetical protein